ncbi:LysR substrate-binding domain-containing protein [Corynebacterium sp. YIM 101645]|uniref:LysR substrate-binding domain-containing protein n=1 Tax=Corynebacterium lemuris TaxID=1859292 RepID=A0ABT2FVI4_9CORY|nr:LysR substrate-binding domain-containing protein [Corynebacterium lemuris]MCS5478057.1 LysR substrate-binding domain-containing protein [Corynebacterium lemuris]
MFANVTLRQMEYFVAVADNETVAAAADQLFLTPSALSLALGTMEKSIGAKLLVRQRAKGTYLTAIGKELVVHARQVLAAAQNFESAVEMIQGELVGPLRVGCFETLSPWVIPPILEHFSRSHPRVEVEVLEASSEELEEKLQKGQLDAAFMFQLQVPRDLESVGVAQFRPQVMLSPDHHLAAFEELSLEQLEGEDAILLSLTSALNLANSILLSAGFTPNIRWKVRNVDTLRSLVARGFGYNIVLGRPGRKDTHDGLPLAFRNITNKLPENSLRLVYPQGNSQNARLEALQMFALEEFPKLSPRTTAVKGPEKP